MPSGTRRKAIPLGDILQRDFPSYPCLPVVCGDPGGTTGYVVTSVPADTLYPDHKGNLRGYAGITVHNYEQMEFETDEVIHAMRAVQLARRVQEETGVKVPLVVESFVLRKFSMNDSLLSPVRINSKIKEIHREWTGYGAGEIREVIAGRGDVEDDAVSQLFWQSPATAKTNAPDARLERWGLLISAPGMVKGGAHARDALRHAVAFYRRASQSETLRDLAWGVAA